VWYFADIAFGHCFSNAFASIYKKECLILMEISALFILNMIISSF
jgi:hypothetical protein